MGRLFCYLGVGLSAPITPIQTIGKTKPGRGGRRPGSGRKSLHTAEYQATRRAQVEAIVTAEEWAKAVRALLKEAQRGNVKAFGVLAPYVVGALPREVSGEVDGHRFVFVIE